jgi:hypothetical protein
MAMQKENIKVDTRKFIASYSSITKRKHIQGFTPTYITFTV